METVLPLYPIKADATTLRGVKLTLGAGGSVEGDEMILDKTSLVCGLPGGTTNTTVDKSKMELVTSTHKNHLAADSMKVSNEADTIHLECNKEGIVVLNPDGQTNLNVGKVELKVGSKTTSIESETLTTDVNEFTLSNTVGSLVLDAPTIELIGALSMPVDTVNTPEISETNPLGVTANRYIRVMIGPDEYKIPLYKDPPPETTPP